MKPITILLINLTLILLVSGFNNYKRQKMSTKISSIPWGEVDGKQVEKFTLKNEKLEVDVISFGATITSIRVPDKNKHVQDVILGFDNLEGYQSKENPYFGATIGRVANRIKNGQFTIDNVTYQVTKNNGNNTLHGGLIGWSHKVWDAEIVQDGVLMKLISPDDDQGFPGAVCASVLIKLKDNKLILEMRANTSKATFINLTNHAYFNLAGQESNATEIYKHIVQIKADRWTVTDSNSIPTGEIRNVANSYYDLQEPKTLGNVINKVQTGGVNGYDFNFCLPKFDSHEKIFVAKVKHPDSGRTLQIFSNQPGVQFYTANSIPEEGIKGKNGKVYHKHEAFCLETQNYPDAINHKNFPNSILRPGEEYYHIVTYQFGIE